MNRERIVWSVSLLLLLTLAVRVPGTLAQRDDDYTFVRTLVDIHRQVANNYVDPVEEDELRQSAIDGLLETLDPYSIYIPPSREEEFNRMLEGSFKGVGIQLNQLDDGRIEVVTPIDGSPALKAGVLAGDIILKVNGESIDGLRLPEIVKKVGGPLNTEVKLTVKHVTGEEVELSMMREEIVVPTVKGYQRTAENAWDYYICDDPKIAYLRVSQFTPDTFAGVKDALTPLLADGMRGLILDLRYNPGGRLDQALQILDLFIDKGILLSTKGRNRPESIVQATEAGTLPKFPMVVLINEHSASASEVVAGSLMDNHRAVVIGSRSYGKGSVQEVIPLDQKGGELKLTVAYYYLPSGRLVHRKKDATDWGVEPQIKVLMDKADEAKLIRQRYEQEIFRRPQPKATTQTTATRASATGPASTRTADGLIPDLQLQRAVDTMIAVTILQENPGTGKRTPVPSKGASITTVPVVQPTTAPTTEPTTEPTTAPMIPTPNPAATRPARESESIPATAPAAPPTVQPVATPASTSQPSTAPTTKATDPTTRPE